MKRRLSLALILALVALLGSVAPSLAAEQVYDPRTIELGKKIACPICEGQSIAASQSGLAHEMMNTIEAKVQAGQSDEEILNYFSSRFGDDILLEPPREGFTLTLWWIPVVVLAVGALVVVLYLRDSTIRTSREVSDDEREMDPELEAIAHEYLDDPPGGTSLATGRRSD